MSRLNQINVNTNKYEETIPSTGDKVSFRPFQVSDEKILMIAGETEDVKQITSSIRQVLNRCYDDLENKNLSTFDIEYLFVKLRGKSVSEKQIVGIDCGGCDHQNDIEVDLDNTYIKTDPAHTNRITISKDVMIELSYPDLEIISTLSDNNVESMFNAIATCLSKVYQGDEVIDCRDETVDAKLEFVNSLSSEQFSGIQQFFNTMPKLTYDVKHTCKNCEKEIVMSIEGMQSFFG